MSSSGFGSKIVDKVGYTVPLVLCGVLLPLAVWGGSVLLSYALAHLGAASIFIGALTWSNVWPVMAIAGIVLLFVGVVIDLARKVSAAIKKAKIKKEAKKMEKEEKAIMKDKEKGKFVDINKEHEKAIKQGEKKNKITSKVGKNILQLDDRNKERIYENKGNLVVRNKDIIKGRNLKNNELH